MKPQEEWFRLVESLCNAVITPEEHARLETILKESAEARRFYREYLDIQPGLEQPMVVEQSAVNPDEKVVAFPGAWQRGWRVAAAALVLIGFLVSHFGRPPPDQPRAQPTAVVPEPPMAVLTRAIDVRWEHKRRFQAELGQPISEKWLRLESGVAEVTFSSGATVSIEGPAQLRLDSAMKCFSKFGKLAANCPASAHGFTIRFRGGRVVDLGTEFALESQPEGNTEVHVLSGEVIVALTDGQETVIKEQSLTGNSAVEINPDNNAIDPIVYNAAPYRALQRAALIRSQPIKLQFDLGHRAGVYAGTNAPAHAAGDMFAHEHVWTQIVGDQSGAFVMADGNICPHPIRVDYGHGTDVIDWDATPADPWGRIYHRATGVFDSALCQDHRPWDDDLGIRVAGLPAGTYRVYALCRSVRRPGASYDVSFGVNLDRQLPEPTVFPPLEETGEPAWVAGETYAVAEVTVSDADDWITFITRYSRERSVRSTPHHGRSVLLGLQIVETKKFAK